jgi:hypothetical protein
MKDRQSKVTLMLVLGSVLVLGSGVLHGIMDHRWGTSEAFQAGARRLQAIPMQLGAWQVVKDGELDEPTIKMLRCTGNFLRVYKNKLTGREVSVVMMVGPTGPLVQHTPDVCYRSSNYRTDQSRRRVEIVDRSGASHPFFLTTFRENAAAGRRLQVHYGWYHAGTWRAPENPRTGFSAIPMVYKIQVATFIHPNGELNEDVGGEFLKEALPALELELAKSKDKIQENR